MLVRLVSSSSPSLLSRVRLATIACKAVAARSASTIALQRRDASLGAAKTTCGSRGAPVGDGGSCGVGSSWNSVIALRTYLGDAGHGVPKLSPEEERLLRIAKPKSDKIHAEHVKLPAYEDIPESSWGEQTSSNEIKEGESILDEIRRKRLVYRSKQRGWLEVDLLLGTWANENVSKLSAEELDEYETFVNLETIDIYNIITLRVDVPESMKRQGNDQGPSVVEQIQQWAKSSPLGKADPEKYKDVKAKANLI